MKPRNPNSLLTINPRKPPAKSTTSRGKPPARSTILLHFPTRQVHYRPASSLPPPHPRSPARPAADGADRPEPRRRRKIASVRGPHSRSFAREPPAPDYARRLVPRRSGRRARGARGLRSAEKNAVKDRRCSHDIPTARAVPHAARPPGIGRGAGALPADQPGISPRRQPHYCGRKTIPDNGLPGR